MTAAWTVIAQQQDGKTRVERNGHQYRLVTSEASWPLDEVEGNYWEWTVEDLSPALVDYHLGNLALAHAACLASGHSFSDTEDTARVVRAAEEE